jgi:hypothetical protein
MRPGPGSTSTDAAPDPGADGFRIAVGPNPRGVRIELTGFTAGPNPHFEGGAS